MEIHPVEMRLYHVKMTLQHLLSNINPISVVLCCASRLYYAIHVT